MEMEQLDLVVIGAGWYGLGTAKQYHEEHPDHAMAILDYASTLGGVWAQHRLYPGLKSNNLLGTYEYPGFPMEPAVFGIQRRQHPTGEAIHAYHVAFAKAHGIHDKVRCGTKVVSAEHVEEGGWVITTRPVADSDPKNVRGPEERLFARRLVVATGLASEPFMPHVRGQEEYCRPLFHSKQFLDHAHTVDPGVTKRVTVFGGTKYAWDAAYAYGKAGVKVDWVIRASGHGPCWMAPSYVTPFNKWLEKLVNTRFLTWFSPCIWSEAGGYSAIRSFLHGTALGRAITDTFWRVLGADVHSLNGFDKHPEVGKLRPWGSPMFAGCSFSILTYDTDFFELVRDGTIRVHIADLSHLSEGKVHLDDEAGTALESDAMLCVTGWKHIPAFKFLPEGIEREIGIPHFVGDDTEGSEVELASQRDLFDKADEEILRRFPRLRDPPVFNDKFVPMVKQGVFSTSDEQVLKPLSPVLLYHFIAPASSRFLRAKDLAFAGGVMNFSNATCAYIQGLWITAFFDGKLARDPSAAVAPVADDGRTANDALGVEENKEMTLDGVQYETVLHNRFGRWRYPGEHGAKYPDFVFEAVPYMDMLMRDLGLRVHRKGGWFRELTDPYGPEDYADINDEWRRKFGKRD